MPRVVDHEERRRALAEAFFTVIGTRGFEAVSLREVADMAGVSMGAVQHYFSTKNDMLLFALGSMRARVMQRVQSAIAELAEPTRRDVIRAGIRAMLPVDEPGRQEAIVNIAFFSAATVAPPLAKVLRDGYERLLAATVGLLEAARQAGELRRGVEVDAEAAALFYLIQGLTGPMLIGVCTPDEALALIDRHLDRIFR